MDGLCTMSEGDMHKKLDEEYRKLARAEIARLTAELEQAKRIAATALSEGTRVATKLHVAESELAAAKDELRSKDANYTPLLDSYAASCQRLSDALEASQERERVLREAIEWALGERGEFGDEPPPTVMKSGMAYRRRYWWRTELRKRAALGEP